MILIDTKYNIGDVVYLQTDVDQKKKTISNWILC